MIAYDRQFQKDAGEFYIPETKCWFSFRPSTNPWGIKHELIHEIDVLDGTRCAVVRKGVAYVAVDEDANGNPVLERWSITKRRIYLETTNAR